MTGVPVDSFAAKQDFAFGPSAQHTGRDFLGMHHLRMLAAALAMGVCLLYRCRFQRIGADPCAASLMRNGGQTFATRYNARCWCGTPGQSHQKNRHHARFHHHSPLSLPAVELLGRAHNTLGAKHNRTRFLCQSATSN